LASGWPGQTHTTADWARLRRPMGPACCTVAEGQRSGGSAIWRSSGGPERFWLALTTSPWAKASVALNAARSRSGPAVGPAASSRGTAIQEQRPGPWRAPPRWPALAPGFGHPLPGFGHAADEAHGPARGPWRLRATAPDRVVISGTGQHSPLGQEFWRPPGTPLRRLGLAAGSLPAAAKTSGRDRLEASPWRWPMDGRGESPLRQAIWQA